MASTINASTSPAAIVQTADGTANLSLQSNGTTIAALTSTGMAVTGTLSASGVTTFAAGTAALPAITTTGDTDTGIWFPAANTVAASTSGTEAMRIDSSGNLLIGQTGTILQNSNSLFYGATAANTGYLILNHASGSNAGNSFAIFGYNASSIGSITQSGTTAVLYNVTSDQRLKENIQDAESASSLIDSLQVRQFDWKTDNTHQRYGFIAQELVTVVPEAVHQPTDSDEMMAVDYSKLVPMLVKEIQSLRQRITALEGA